METACEIMRFKLAICAFVVGTAATAASANAADFYASAGVSSFDSEQPGAKLAAIQGRVGAKFLPYLGVEAEAGTGISSDTWHLLYAPYLGTVKTELNYQVAGYVVGTLPVSTKAELFARVGYGKAKFDQDVLMDGQGGSSSVSRDGWAFGAGAQYFFDGKSGVRLDYTRHEVDEGHIDAWSAGFVHRF